MKKAKEQKTERYEKMPVVNEAAAGIDVDSSSHFIAIGQNKEDVKEFGVYTEALHELCKHLVATGRITVAISTLSLVPDIKKTGGKVINSRTRKGKGRLSFK